MHNRSGQPAAHDTKHRQPVCGIQQIGGETGSTAADGAGIRAADWVVIKVALGKNTEVLWHAYQKVLAPFA